MTARAAYHEGQEIEVAPLSEMFGVWRHAKIVRNLSIFPGSAAWGKQTPHLVEFIDGQRLVIGSDHIRPVLA